jgi:protein required for attachment to host cells
MTTDSWLPLAEYSMKHQVSISTLRRRIKAEDIQYRFEEGKYLILDDEVNQVNTDEHRPSLRSDAQPRSAVHQKTVSAQVQSPEHHLANQVAAAQSAAAVAQDAGESVITAANRLLTDLKKAYTQVLQEKETQIQGLKQEVADLNTLIKVLEFENEKLRNYNR